MLNLSDRINDDRTFQKLGRCLGLRDYEIDGARANQQDISMAAKKMLQTWFRRNEDTSEAWEKLAEALRKAELNIYIAQILKK